MDDPLILTVLAVANLTITTAFICVFAAEPWRKSTFGQSVMALAVAIWLFSLLAVLRQVFGPDYWGREWLLGIGRGLVLLGMFQRLVVLARERARDR